MRKSALPAIAVIAPFATMAAFPAHATTLSAKDILGQFNAIIFGDFSTSADVEGRTAVGGNLTGGATFDMKPGNISASAFAGLTVYGDATASKNYNIANGGGVTIAGSNNASFTLNGGGVVFIGSANSGNLNTSNGSGSVTIGGANSGTLQINSNGSVYVGRGNCGRITTNSSTSVAVNGGNSGNVTLNSGGTLSLVGSNHGAVTLNGGTFTYSANKHCLGSLRALFEEFQ